MKHSKLLKSYINDQSLLDEMILVRSQKVRLSSSSSYSLVGIFDIEKLIEFKLPFLVFYYGVSKIVKNKNETMYSVYFDENNIYIDQYKKAVVLVMIIINMLIEVLLVLNKKRFINYYMRLYEYKRT